MHIWATGGRAFVAVIDRQSKSARVAAAADPGSIIPSPFPIIPLISLRKKREGKKIKINLRMYVPNKMWGGLGLGLFSSFPFVRRRYLLCFVPSALTSPS